MAEVSLLAEIASACKDVNDWDMPSSADYTALKQWVSWQDGTDEQGRFLGWCPMHDTPGGPLTALFNFNKRMLWCQSEPSCHAPRRAMSLQNMFYRIAVRTLTGNGNA